MSLPQIAGACLHLKIGGVKLTDAVRENGQRWTADQIDQIRRSPPLRMSLQEAAIYLGVSPRKLRYDCKRRLIPYVKLGGKLIFKLESLNAALDRLEVRSVG